LPRRRLLSFCWATDSCGGGQRRWTTLADELTQARDSQQTRFTCWLHWHPDLNKPAISANFPSLYTRVLSGQCFSSFIFCSFDWKEELPNLKGLLAKNVVNDRIDR
jgi:hypothetical protein